MNYYSLSQQQELMYNPVLELQREKKERIEMTDKILDSIGLAKILAYLAHSYVPREEAK